MITYQAQMSFEARMSEQDEDKRYTRATYEIDCLSNVMQCIAES